MIVKPQTELEQLYHDWRENHLIAKIFFNYLNSEIQILQQQLVGLRHMNLENEDRIMHFGSLSAMIEYLQNLESNFKEFVIDSMVAKTNDVR